MVDLYRYLRYNWCGSRRDCFTCNYHSSNGMLSPKTWTNH